MFDSKTDLIHIFDNILTSVAKIKVTAIKAGFENSEDFTLSNFHIKNDKQDKKG